MRAYYCRDCGRESNDHRSPIGRFFGLSLRCLHCGGICDPSEATIRKRDAILRNRMAVEAAAEGHHPDREGHPVCPVCGWPHDPQRANEYHLGLDKE